MADSTIRWWFAVILATSLISGTCRADEQAAWQSLKALGAKEKRDLQRDDNPIVGLALKGPQITDGAIDSVIELVELQTLSISDAAISQAGLKKLPQLTKLTRLSLRGCKVTADDLPELSNFTALEWLDLRDTSAFASSNAKPIRMPTLKRLIFSMPRNLPWNKSFDMSVVAELEALEELMIVGGAAPSPIKTDFTPLQRLKKLTVLNLEYFPQTALIGLGNLTSVREVVLHGGGWFVADSGHVLSDITVNELKSLPSLSTLDLTGREISAAAFEGLGTLKQLRALNLKGTNISDAELKHLQSLKSLVSLELDGTHVTQKGVSDLRLSLPSTKIVFQVQKESEASEAAKKELSRIGGMFTMAIRADTRQQSVNSVFLQRTSVQDDDLKILRAFPEMAGVDLSDTAVTDRGVEILMTLPQLTTLKLNGTKITDTGIQQLAQLTELRKLELGRLPITDAGLEKLRGLTKLRMLTIDGSRISSQSIDQLKAALPKLALTVQ